MHRSQDIGTVQVRDLSDVIWLDIAGAEFHSLALSWGAVN